MTTDPVFKIVEVAKASVSTHDSADDFDLVDELEYGINPSKLLAFLLKGRERYPGEKDIALAAFQAWVLLPNERASIKYATIVRIFQKIDQLEKAYARYFPDKSIAAAAKAVRKKYRVMFEDVVEPLGSYQAILGAPSRLMTFVTRSESFTRASHVYRLIALMHHQLTRMRDWRDGQPSFKKAVRVYEALFPKRTYEQLGYAQLRTYWRQLEPSLSFVYAGLAPLEGPEPFRAPDLRNVEDLTEDQSLLGEFYHGRPKFSGRAVLFHRFVARARFAQESILGAIKQPPDTDSSVMFPEGLAPESIHPPTLDAIQESQSAEIFRDERRAGARRGPR